MALPLSVFWLLLSGHYTRLTLLLGAGSVTLVCWLSFRADLRESYGSVRAVALRLPLYALWLGKEVLVAAVGVVRRVWSPALDVRPRVAWTDASGLAPLSQVIYANSITLTPGTLSMRLRDDSIAVHGLDESYLDDLADGRMLGRVRRLAPSTPEEGRPGERR
jgi:multicomponent Na+:H+ antiporter subunit E